MKNIIENKAKLKRQFQINDIADSERTIDRVAARGADKAMK
jgi:hypothetical protein